MDSHADRPRDTPKSIGWTAVPGQRGKMECVRCHAVVDATPLGAMDHHRKHWPHAGKLISDCEDRIISRD